MATDKNLRIASLLHRLVAEFISHNANTVPLITVTNVHISRDLKKADIFVSVFPEDKEGAALSYLLRKGGEIRSYIGKHSKLKVLPVLSFSLDFGEKNRQHIDEISKEINP